VADDRGQTARHRFAQSILDNIEIVGTPIFRHFSSVNLPYLSRCSCSSRAVWTLFALSTTGWVTMILSARGLWTTFRARRAARLASTSGMPATDH
jgi:hypothetical protein